MRNVNVAHADPARYLMGSSARIGKQQKRLAQGLYRPDSLEGKRSLYRSLSETEPFLAPLKPECRPDLPEDSRASLLDRRPLRHTFATVLNGHITAYMAK